MFRTNGGLIGDRRLPTISSATGMWSTVEQVTAARALSWPGKNPIPLLNPILWYDFADESTVTLSGSQINTISDKGSRGWTLTKSTTGPLYPTGINGLKCCNWGTAGHSNFLRNTTTTSTGITEIYIVLDAGFGSTFPSYNGLVTGISSWTLSGDQAFSRFYAGTGFSEAYINGSASNVFSSGILPAINSPCLLRVVGNVTATDGFQIGNDRNIGSRGWSELVGEVIVFSTALSTNDRATIQNFLASKWGLTIS